MAVSPSGDPPDEAQAIDATCTIRLPDTATVPVHGSTETVMWRRFKRAAFDRNRIREAVTAKVCCGAMEGDHKYARRS